jgi:hypothetical protein
MIVTSGKLRPSITALAVLVTSSLIAASIAHATELKVLSPHVMKPVLDDLTPQGLDRIALHEHASVGGLHTLRSDYYQAAADMT